MDENAVGCVTGGIIGAILLVISIIIGGQWRTEVTLVQEEVPAGTAQVVFKDNVTAKHFLAGLVKGKQPDLQTFVSKYVRDNDKLTKLTVTTRHTWIDNILTGVTMLIYCPVTVTIEGAYVQQGSSP